MHRGASTNLDFYISHVFTFENSEISIEMYDSRHFPSSGNTYHLIYKTYHTVIVKMNENDTIEWSKLYDILPNRYGFDVAPNESYLCFCPSIVNFVNIIQISTTNGSVIKSVSTNNYNVSWSGFEMHPDYSSLAISDDNTTAYFSAFQSEGISSHYCRWNQDANDGKIHCSTNQIDSGSNQYNLAKSINPIDFNLSYITIEESNGDFMEVRKIDYSNTSNYNIWTTKVN